MASQSARDSVSKVNKISKFYEPITFQPNETGFRNQGAIYMNLDTAYANSKSIKCDCNPEEIIIELPFKYIIDEFRNENARCLIYKIKVENNKIVQKNEIGEIYFMRHERLNNDRDWMH